MSNDTVVAAEGQSLAAVAVAVAVTLFDIVLVHSNY
jgi:hypothetical protein